MPMRAFLAVPVLPPALDQGERLLDRLRGALPAVRWVRPEGLHLTLHFFADLRDDDVAPLLDALRADVAATAPFAARLAGLGSFPRPGDERVLWIGMADGAGQAAALQRTVAGHVAALGHAAETRTFHPHVTLGRPRERFSPPARRAWEELAASALPAYTADELRLYRSHPGAGGSRYEVLERLPLRG